ncbi:MAG: FAD-dependent monooxygenase [Gammaproteobacteria bacterium]|nr:FAD-dependent monooxygenase [Gammaproteobacteria bacterium]
MRRNSVTVLGAGLCGALLSIILARRGIRVTLLERAPDPRKVEPEGGRSINLAMAARGIRGLRHAGVFKRVEPLLLPLRGRRIHGLDGSTELHPYGQSKSEVIYSVSRAELNRLLVDEAARHDVNLRFRQEAIGYDTAAGVLRVRDLDGSGDYEVPANPLIAADGAGSIVRRAFAGKGIIGGREELLQHRYRELVIPAGPGDSFRMDKEALHIWPRGGFMLIALPNPGGDFTLTLFLPVDGATSFAALDSDEKVRAFFDANFPDAVPLIDDLVGTWHRNPAGVLGTVRSARWRDGGKVLLIGDAAHAVVPFHGQGMNLTFEDCVVLDQILEKTEADWETVFEAFERAQIDNANAIADMALENYIEMRDTVREPKHLLRRELAFALERRLPNRFIPRYSMIMFHAEIPYAVARARGVIQQALLEKLTESADRMDEIDLDAAARLVESRLPPLDQVTILD